jgi:hypothetical protein
LAGELDVRDAVLIIEFHPDIDFIAAGWVVAMCMQAGGR